MAAWAVKYDLIKNKNDTFLELVYMRQTIANIATIFAMAWSMHVHKCAPPPTPNVQHSLYVSVQVILFGSICKLHSQESAGQIVFRKPILPGLHFIDPLCINNPASDPSSVINRD